jgi:2-polyprenyl-3-methyl-5-hydroxy-6-metoxy-1,4-benzoquinol methylase
MHDLITTLHNLTPFTSYPYSGSDEPCNLCGDAAKHTVCETDRRLKRLKTVACATCGLLRTDPMPTEEELGRYYTLDYRWDYQFASSRRPPRFHLARSRREARSRMQMLQPFIADRLRLLDVGSGSGEFLAEATAHGHATLGLEPGADFAEYSRRTHGMDVRTLRWHEADFRPGSFDVITCNHVLEHLREPVAALCKMAEWLDDDGIAYVAVPNALARRRHSFQHFHFAHVHSFTPQTLIWAGMVAGLVPDPRWSSAGTEILLRKRREGAVRPNWTELHGVAVVAQFPPASVARFVMSGEWLGDARRQLAKALRDSFAPVSGTGM